MSLQLKIRNPTPRDGMALCHTCKNGVVLTGFAESDEAIYCDIGWPIFRVPFRVRECTGYRSREHAQLDDMEDAATVIEVPLGRAAGFNPPKPSKEDGKA